MEDFKVDCSEEESFPVPFNKFLEYTNVIDIVYDQIKKGRRNSYEDFINNMVYVRKIARRCYLHFYMKPNNRKQAPLKDLTVSEDCPKDLKMHLMKIPEKYQTKMSQKVNTSEDPAIEVDDDLGNPKPSTSENCKSKPVDNVDSSSLEELIASSNFPPPSFKVFKKFVNFEEEIKQRKLFCSSKREKFELEFYREFYAAPALRHKFNWKLRPCPRKLREQILTHLPLKDEIILPERSNITVAANLTPSKKRSSSPSKKLILPQAKKQKTMETIAVPTNTPLASNTNQQTMPNNKPPKKVQVKTASWCSYRIFNDYFAQKTRQEDVNIDSNKKIILEFEDNYLTNENNGEKSVSSPEHALKEVMPPTSNANPIQENKKHDLPIKNRKKKNLFSSEESTEFLLTSTHDSGENVKKMIRIETKEKSVSPKDTCAYRPSLCDSNETGIRSELDMSTVRNFTVRSKERQVPNLNPSGAGNTNELEAEALVREVQVQSQEESVFDDSDEKVVKKRIENPSKENSVSSKDTSSYLASEYDSNDTDVSRELDMSTVRNFPVPSKEKQLPPKSCTANLSPSGSGNTNELDTEALVNEVPVQLQEESLIHDSEEELVKERIEIEPEEKSVSPKDTCAYPASEYDSNDTDVSRELDISTVRNFPALSKAKEITPKSCIANLNPSGGGRTNELETEALVNEVPVQLQEESIINDIYEKVVKKRIEMASKEKLMSPKYTCAYLASNYHSDETDVSSELSTVRNFPVRSTENQLHPKTSLPNLSPSGGDCLKDIFFRKVDKSYTLAYAVRRSRGLKRRILLAILKMSLDEFSKYARIHGLLKYHEDSEVLKKVYEFVITAEQTWPPILYMTLSDTLEYLMSKGIVFKDLNLQHISPKLLHFEELAIITNFDEIVRLDYFKETSRKKIDEPQLKERRHSYYNRCWAQDEWIWQVPTVDKNWELKAKCKDTDTVARLITPLDDVSADTENIEMTEAFDMETNSTSSSRAADDIKPQNTVTEFLSASSWESVLSELEEGAQVSRRNEDDVETVIFPIAYKESASASQNPYKSNDGSVEDIQYLQAKKITNNEDYNSIQTSDEASTSVQQAEPVNQESIIFNVLNKSCSKDLKSTPEPTQMPSKSNESNQVERNIAKHLQETTNKTLLPLSPNIFITSSGSTTSQPRSHHDLPQSCTSTFNLSNASLAISSCTTISSQVNDFFVNMPNTQNQIESLPIDEMLCNDPLNDEAPLKESLETSSDNLLSHSVHNLKANYSESGNQANNQTEADTLASLEVREEQQQWEEILPTHSASEEETNAVLNGNTPEYIPTKILEQELNARDVSNRELESSKSHISEVDKDVSYSPQLDTQAKTYTTHLKSTDTQLHVDQSPRSSESSDERNSVSNENSTSPNQVELQPNESFTRISEYVLTGTLQSESYLMDESGRVPLSVKQEIVNRNTQFESKYIVQTENCNLSTIVIDDSDDEAESNQSTSNVKSAVKVEAKFLNNLQFSFDDSNNSVHVHTLRETPPIIIDDDCDVNETSNKTATNLIDQLMNPSEQIQFPSTSLSGISSSLLNDAASTFSEAQRFPSSLEESGSVHQTLQSEPDQETQNSNDTLNDSSEDVALLLEINVQKVDDFIDIGDITEDEQCDSEPEVALNLIKDQQSKGENVSPTFSGGQTERENVSPTFSSGQTTNLPTEEKKDSTNIAAIKHKKSAAKKSNRQIENKNCHLVPQITHAFRSLPVAVVKAKPNENPKTAEINTTPSSSTNISSATEISNTLVATNNNAANSTKTVNSGSTINSFSASQALATDCTLFDNSQLLRDLEKVQNNNIETSTTAVCAQLIATSSTSSLASTTSTTSSSQQEPSSSKQNVGTKK